LSIFWGLSHNRTHLAATLMLSA